MSIGDDNTGFGVSNHWWYPSYPYPVYPQQPQYPQPQQMGWTCPRCGRVWSPAVASCNCQGMNYTWTFNITSTNGYDDFDLVWSNGDDDGPEDDDDPQGAPV